jgi:cyclopropane fatty-acyl-phospholipid synthase-like methyltransferase
MDNKILEESIITAMELTDKALVKHLPYIFQDWWELGSISEEVIKIIKKYKTNYSSINVLDLGSGKGAVSIKIASELKCKCFGIDGIDDFVNFSNDKSKEYSVDNICTFETNDIRTRIKTLEKYDIILLMAIGPVLGNYYETLTKLSSHLNNDGLIIINDGYIENGCNKDYPNLLKENELLKQVNNAGMEIIEKITINEFSNIDKKYENENKNIQKRCKELIEKYPDDKEALLGYIERQKREYEILTNEIIPAIFVIKKKMK